MSNTEEIKIPLKIFVEKGRNKVLFAEADYSFIDILFSFMTLPMGTIVRLVEKNSDLKLPSIGCLNTLYEGLANLPTQYLSTEELKDMLLHPRNSAEAQCRKLKLNVDDTRYFVCENWNCLRHSCTLISTYNTAKCSCGKFLNREIVQKYSEVNTDHHKRGVFVTETASFMVTDDLCVMPNLPGSCIQILGDVGTRNMRLLEERTVNVGFQEVLKLLKLALISRSPLTDLFLCETYTVKSELGNFTRPVISKDSTTSSKNIDVRVFVQKSNGKPLFIQAEEDFVDFLFSLFAIPLGTVLFLLSGDTSVVSIDNLYRSISNLNVGRYMISQDLKDMLLHPKLAQHYFCGNKIFTLEEKSSPQLYCHSVYYTSGKEEFSITTRAVLPPGNSGRHFGDSWSSLSFQGPMLHGGYVTKPAMFMVTDDLVVTPLSSISTMSILDKLKGLSILKASLSFSSALFSDLNLLLKKPKKDNSILKAFHKLTEKASLYFLVFCIFWILAAWCSQHFILHGDIRASVLVSS